MFTDPQSVTVATTPISLPAIARSEMQSQYGAADKSFDLIISRQEGNRNRFLVRLNFRKIAADPFTPTQNVEYTGSAYLVVDAPIVGFTNQELADNALGLTAWATEANLLKVLGRET